MVNDSAHLTPYAASYGTCERTDVKLLIYPGDMSPGAVTEILGIEPTTVQIKGARHVNSLGVERVTKTNGWFLASEGQVDSLDARHHFDWLLGRIAAHGARLKELQAIPGVRMSISCVWWSAHGHGGPTLWPEQMRQMADLNLECGFDVYFFGDEEEGTPSSAG